VDNLPMVGDTEELLGEIEAFLTGGRRGGDIDRELLTVLFTDIVDATTTASRLGDARWRSLLADHDKIVRSELERYGGVEVKTIGDAFLATFAGPPSQAVRCGRAILSAVQRLGIQLRCGLHTGECEHIGGDVGGWRCTSPRGCRRWPVPASCWPRARPSAPSSQRPGVGVPRRGEAQGVPGTWPLFALQL